MTRRVSARLSIFTIFTIVTVLIVLAAVTRSSAQAPTDHLLAAIRGGDVGAVTALLDKDPGRATRPDAQGIPPLFWAALAGQGGVVDLLLARGADANASSPQGTALHAAVIGGFPDLIRTLAANGADVNEGGTAGLPPLLLAARRGQATCAEALLERGARADVRDAGGNTALLLAASYGHESIVRALLARRAGSSVTSLLGITALDAALREGHTAIAAILRAGGAVLPARPTPTGAYLGQPPPGATRRLFAPGFVSTERRELNAAFTPDGRTLFFSRDRSPRGTRMLMTQLTSDGWQPPVPAPFSLGDDVDMFVTADGDEVYFCSADPGSGQASPPSAQQAIVIAQPNVDIWVSRRQGDTWGAATRLGPEVNSPVAADYYPTLTRSGTLYFSSNRPGSLGDNDIYRARRVDGRWTAAENLGPVVNSASREYDPYIAPDESYLIFASERAGGLGRADLYVSTRQADGSWGVPVNLGPSVNSATGDYTPMLSPDGRYLFFTSATSGSDDIHWIDASVIRKATATMRQR